MGGKKKSLPWVPIITSILGLIGVLATAYFGYLQVRSKHQLEKYKFDTTQGPRQAARVPAGAISDIVEDKTAAYISGELTPTIQYSLSRDRVGLRIGNSLSKGIIIVSDLTLHWDYAECSAFRAGEPGAAMTEYQYQYFVDITASRGSKLMDDRAFKYGPGDIDQFNVLVKYPARGVYQIWLEFKYSEFGKDDFKLYQTTKASLEICQKGTLDLLRKTK